VARLAVFVAEDANFRGDAGGGLLEAERHVVAQIGAALPARAAPAPPSPAKNLVEAEQITKDILEFLEDRRVDSAGLESAAAQARMSEAVVDRALLRIGENAICLARLAEILLGVLLLFRIPIRVPLQRGLAIR
jgi:hypothetical protein